QEKTLNFWSSYLLEAEIPISIDAETKLGPTSRGDNESSGQANREEERKGFDFYQKSMLGNKFELKRSDVPKVNWEQKLEEQPWDRGPAICCDSCFSCLNHEEAGKLEMVQNETAANARSDSAALLLKRLSEDSHEFKANLGYTTSSRTLLTMHALLENTQSEVERKEVQLTSHPHS
ncbi:hypothetical protein STEG23_016753, partial [Scotinomys teguina]